MDVDEVSGIAQSLNASKLSQDYQVAAVKKALDVQKQEGDAALQLLKTATLAEPGSPGSLIDVRA